MLTIQISLGFTIILNLSISTIHSGDGQLQDHVNYINVILVLWLQKAMIFSFLFDYQLLKLFWLFIKVMNGKQLGCTACFGDGHKP
jgi:hypothetical protein